MLGRAGERVFTEKTELQVQFSLPPLATSDLDGLRSPYNYSLGACFPCGI